MFKSLIFRLLSSRSRIIFKLSNFYVTKDKKVCATCVIQFCTAKKNMRILIYLDAAPNEHFVEFANINTGELINRVTSRNRVSEEDRFD